jgi:hypothetical protein
MRLKIPSVRCKEKGHKFVILNIIFMLFVSDDATEKTLVDEEAFVSERVAALNVPLFRTGDPAVEEEEVELDHFPMVKKKKQSYLLVTVLLIPSTVFL